MIDLLLQVAEWLTAPDTLGLIVIALIVGPVIVLIIIAMLDTPGTFRVPGLFIGSLILIFGARISGFAIASVLLGFIVPQ